MEKIWKIFDDETYKNYEDYEKSNPVLVLDYYGQALEEDMKNMLKYDVTSNVSSIDSYPIYLQSSFYIRVPDNKYRIKVFETNYTSEHLYPCKLHSLLTENRYDCTSKEDLSEKILGELKNERFQEKIYYLLRHFYSKEEVEKLNK